MAKTGPFTTRVPPNTPPSVGPGTKDTTVVQVYFESTDFRRQSWIVFDLGDGKKSRRLLVEINPNGESPMGLAEKLRDVVIQLGMY